MMVEFLMLDQALELIVLVLHDVDHLVTDDMTICVIRKGE